MSARRIRQLIEAQHPAIRDAFLAAIGNIRSEAAVGLIARLLEAGRVDDVVTALGIDAARFDLLHEAIRTAFRAGGLQGVTEIPLPALRLTSPLGGALPGSPLMRFSFDMRNPAAEAWLRDNSSWLVTEIVASQREAIRETLTVGMRLGQGPRQTALDIVGRVGATGRRSGGIVGLTSQQAQFVANLRLELASGDPATMRQYFTRQRRDKRLDGIVNRAIREGRPVSQADIDRIAGRYSDRLLQLRGEAIARTEGTQAYNEARQQAFEQAVAAGRLRPEWVTKTWGTTLDGRERDSHAALNGVEVGLFDTFITENGAQLRFPGDSSLGAPADEIVNCRCGSIFRVDMIAATMGR